MRTGRYVQLPTGIWGIEVDGKVSPGNKVAIPRPNGSIHIHTVEAVYRQFGPYRVCSVVPVTSATVREAFP